VAGRMVKCLQVWERSISIRVLKKKQEKSIIRIKQYLTINIVEKPEPRFGRGECLNHSAEKKDEPEKQEVEMDMVLVEAYSLMNEPVVQQEGFGWKK